ncbi:MAG: aquaporin family protein [Gammaproteobacteria bacterium]|nr:aquaporin family protein [Gammaproteobacteria bacterium]
MNENDLARKLTAEFVGTAALLAVVVGSGIMGETLSGGNDALALLGNTLATGAILAVLILIFGPVSGAHFNPAVTLAFAMRREIGVGDVIAYWTVQVLGALLGVVVAHLMFDFPVLEISSKARAGFGQVFAESIATCGLVLTILGCVRVRPQATAYAVGLYISAGYWFTSSTSFANPAVTIGRCFTDTFSGIQLAHAPAFIAAQFVGALVATVLAVWLWYRSEERIDHEKSKHASHIKSVSQQAGVISSEGVSRGEQ